MWDWWWTKWHWSKFYHSNHHSTIAPDSSITAPQKCPVGLQVWGFVLGPALRCLQSEEDPLVGFPQHDVSQFQSHFPAEELFAGTAGSGTSADCPKRARSKLLALIMSGQLFAHAFAPFTWKQEFWTPYVFQLYLCSKYHPLYWKTIYPELWLVKPVQIPVEPLERTRRFLF
jgi:hypothetical protein